MVYVLLRLNGRVLLKSGENKRSLKMVIVIPSKLSNNTSLYRIWGVVAHNFGDHKF
jgi:hypothetical protein